MYFIIAIDPSAVAESRGNVELLWSSMSGEDMLKVWLKQHPEVTERQTASQKTDKNKITLPEKAHVANPPTLALLPHVKELAKELDAYERQRGGLPVSLMPSSRQPPSLRSLDEADWG